MSKVEFGEGDLVFVMKEVDGGVEIVKGKLLMVVMMDLRLNELWYVILLVIMKVKKKKLEKVKLEDFGVDVIVRLKMLKVMGKLFCFFLFCIREEYCLFIIFFWSD